MPKPRRLLPDVEPFGQLHALAPMLPLLLPLAFGLVLSLLLLVGCGSAALRTDDETGNEVFYDVPVPAGFSTVRVESGTHHAGGRIPVEVTSIVYSGPPVEPGAFLDHFRVEMPRNGWKELTVAAKGVRLTATKHGTTCAVELTPAGDGPSSRIVIRRFEPETR